MSEKLLGDAAKAGLYCLPLARSEGILETAGKLHFKTHVADLSQCRTIDDALRHLGTALHFPVWYGANFDALYDCLTDSDWQPGRGHVLLIKDLDGLRLAEPDKFATLIEVLQATVEDRRLSGLPFWVLIDTVAQGIPELPAP